MRNVFLVIFCCLLFSCGAEKEEEICQGKLEELIVGDFTFYKDSLTKTVDGITVVKDGGEEYVFTTTRALQFRGWAFVFSNLETGKELKRIEIPTEGPNSMKGGAYYLPLSLGRILAINPHGWIGTYDANGIKISELENELNQSTQFERMLRLETRKGLMYFQFPYLQFGQDPSHPSNLSSLNKSSGPGEMRSTFPLDFSTWLTRVNVESGEIEYSEFGIPEGYEAFEGDMTATQLLGAYDGKRDVFYLAWPYSKEIYVLNGLELQRKVQAKSSIDFNFLPSEIIPWGGGWTVWALPKEASQNIFLVYDEYRDLILKCTKINESGVGETNFERTKHYVFSVYNGDWELKGEYTFDFENEVEVENWFITSEGLFINKPAQASEDEYEFYKIDLSKFVD